VTTADPTAVETTAADTTTVDPTTADTTGDTPNPSQKGTP
jgi:hypothetical protein